MPVYSITFQKSLQIQSFGVTCQAGLLNSDSFRLRTSSCTRQAAKLHSCAGFQSKIVIRIPLELQRGECYIMPILRAKFILSISSPCLLAWPEGQVPKVTVTIGDFQVEAKLLSTKGWRFKQKGDVFFTTGLRELEIDVTKNENDSPPDVVPSPDGTIDLSVQGDFLRSKLPEYQVVARDLANRILRFFQYSLLTPQVQQIPGWDHSLHNPTWFDSTGNELRGRTDTAIFEPVFGLRGELEAKKLSPAELPELQSLLTAPTEPPLALVLLSDAQTAWFEGNLRRAVLEMAICVEVLVKRRFFAEASPAGVAFDYLEDKAKISVRVLELLDAVAEEAFATSYKKQEPDNYQKIDYLFRCRNKIAHRGELTFRDDSSKSVAVNLPMVESWWLAVANLMKWIQSL